MVTYFCSYGHAAGYRLWQRLTLALQILHNTFTDTSDMSLEVAHSLKHTARHTCTLLEGAPASVYDPACSQTCYQTSSWTCFRRTLSSKMRFELPERDPSPVQWIKIWLNGCLTSVIVPFVQELLEGYFLYQK